MRKHTSIKNTVIALAVLFAAFLAAGCAGYYQAPVVPGKGCLFADVSAPMDLDVEKSGLGTKSGEAKSKNVLGLISTGDCSIQTAAKNGGITDIRHVDYKFTNILGVYAEFTTVVHGE